MVRFVFDRMGPTRSPPGLGVALLSVALLGALANAETLTPPYFNLAEGKNITATATCGVDTEGPELFCKLIGSNSDSEPSANVIQGQVGISRRFFFEILARQRDFGAFI